MLTRLEVIRATDKIYSLAYTGERLIFTVVETAGCCSEAIYLATISRINHQSRSAFITYGAGLSGFVNLPTGLNVQEGSSLRVQMVWCGDEKKQPKFRCDWQLVGKYVVYTPGNAKLKSSGQTKELVVALDAAVQEYPGNWVVRSCVKFMPQMPLVIAEMKLLHARGQAVIGGQDFDGTPGYLRILRSLTLAPDCEIITNDRQINQQLLSYQDLWQIDAVTYNPTLDAVVAVAKFESLVNLSNYQLGNGGNLEIYTVGGINLIDVNSGRVVLSHDKLNFAMLDEIYRQICIRNLQGIILLDLLKNQSPTAQERVIEYLKKLFKCDITNTRVLGFSHSGLCELIRNRF